MADGAAVSAPPRSWTLFEADCPEVAAAYDALSAACLTSGPIDPATAALVKLAVSVGGRCERTVHAHAKKALRAGVDPASVRQVALLALPTIGLPAALDARRWIEESLQEHGCRP